MLRRSTLLPLALAAADVHGPAAARWAGERRAAGRYHPYALGEMARKRHAAWASASGAAVPVAARRPAWTAVSVTSRRSRAATARTGARNTGARPGRGTRTADDIALRFR